MAPTNVLPSDCLSFRLSVSQIIEEPADCSILLIMAILTFLQQVSEDVVSSKLLARMNLKLSISLSSDALSHRPPLHHVFPNSKVSHKTISNAERICTRLTVITRIFLRQYIISPPFSKADQSHGPRVHSHHMDWRISP